jgi:DNA-binding response OmpR family regulator
MCALTSHKHARKRNALRVRLPSDVLQRRLVLVAEDDEDIRALVTCRLSRNGFEVVTARNGEEAVLLAEKRAPDLVILDVRMPRLDGFEVARCIRANPRTARVPVMLLTASIRETDIARGLEAGADDYLQKPFSPQELGTRVQTILASK